LGSTAARQPDRLGDAGGLGASEDRHCGRPLVYSDIAIETEGMLRSIIELLGLDLPVSDHTA
jgi:hypothetical protein